MRPLRWFERPRGFLIIVALTAFVVLLCSTSGPFRFVRGRGTSAIEANARLWNGHVPDDARDVWFLSGYRSTRVECTLSRESFEAWCRRMGWRTRPIEDGEGTVVSSERDGLRTIKRGLRFDEMQGDLGFSGSYDVEERRAYVAYSGH